MPWLSVIVARASLPFCRMAGRPACLGARATPTKAKARPHVGKPKMKASQRIGAFDWPCGAVMPYARVARGGDGGAGISAPACSFAGAQRRAWPAAASARPRQAYLYALNLTKSSSGQPRNGEYSCARVKCAEKCGAVACAHVFKIRMAIRLDELPSSSLLAASEQHRGDDAGGSW